LDPGRFTNVVSFPRELGLNPTKVLTVPVPSLTFFKELFLINGIFLSLAFLDRF
jgi:hypothetical protein